MRWGSGRQRHGKYRPILERDYLHPQGAELLAAHATETVQALLREVAETGRPIVVESLRVWVDNDYGDLTLEASIVTMRGPRDA